MTQSKGKYAVIPISPRTGKPYKRLPRKKTKVQYAVRGPRGGIRLLRKETQTYYKTDLAGLNQMLQGTTGGNFVLYEQKLRGGKTKLTAARADRKQKPVLYVKSKYARKLDFGHKDGNYKKREAERKILMIKPQELGGKEVTKVILRGDTLREALSAFHLDIKETDLKGRNKIFGLYYSVIIIITDPKGNIIKIPVNSSFRTGGFPEGKHTFMEIPGFSTRQMALKQKLLTPKWSEKEKDWVSVFILANLHGHMAYAIRQALKDAGAGYRFTSLTTLKDIDSREQERIDRERDQDKTGEIEDKLQHQENSLDRLHMMGGGHTAGTLKNDLKKGKWKVILYAKFEKF